MLSEIFGSSGVVLSHRIPIIDGSKTKIEVSSGSSYWGLSDILDAIDKVHSENHDKHVPSSFVDGNVMAPEWDIPIGLPSLDHVLQENNNYPTLDRVIDEYPEILQYAAANIYRVERFEQYNENTIYSYFSQENESYYLFTPDWVTVVRASQAELGHGVLGLAMPGTNVIKILDTLYGNDYVEVKQHELLHIFFPHKSEPEIRKMTPWHLNFLPKFHKAQ